jgi:hypothetical protein
MKVPGEECGTDGSEKRRAVDAPDRRVGERRAYDPSGRRVRERRASTANRPSPIAYLCAEHPSLSAFIENQIVLGRSPRDIVQGVSARFGLRVSNAAVATYRNNLARTGTRALEQAFEESREEIGRLIHKMETDGGAPPRGISMITGIWRAVRRWLGKRLGNREEATNAEC